MIEVHCNSVTAMLQTKLDVELTRVGLDQLECMMTSSSLCNDDDVIMHSFMQLLMHMCDWFVEITEFCGGCLNGLAVVSVLQLPAVNRLAYGIGGGVTNSVVTAWYGCRKVEGGCRSMAVGRCVGCRWFSDKSI